MRFLFGSIIKATRWDWRWEWGRYGLGKAKDFRAANQVPGVTTQLWVPRLLAPIARRGSAGRGECHRKASAMSACTAGSKLDKGLKNWRNILEHSVKRDFR